MKNKVNTQEENNTIKQIITTRYNTLPVEKNKTSLLKDVSCYVFGKYFRYNNQNS